MPNERRYQGIDVSEWQGRIDFSKVRSAGIRIVYIKATEGTGYTDPEFERNYRDARREGFFIGFYHFLTARSLAEAENEARFFADRIRGKDQHARPVMDFEEFGDLDRDEIRAIALRFLTVLEEETGHHPAIYSDASNAKDRFDDDRLREYPLWIADYGVSRPDMENPWRSWSGWQYTDRGRIAGISGEVDRDYFRRAILLEESERPCSCETANASE
ncbi:MAG: glycoside hydrolase [Lachnospiraceae bacterium]|nr:glycoside hydrolase [Lachnospiraceae bacterium]